MAATDTTVARCESYLDRCSDTLRMARSHTSGEKFVNFLMAASFQELEPHQNRGGSFVPDEIISSVAPTYQFSFECCLLNTASRELSLRGELKPVAPLVFDLLVYLLEHRDRVVPKDELLDRVWKGAVLSAGVVARAILMARRAIGDSGDKPRMIKTVHRVGYRFVANVECQGNVETANLEDEILSVSRLPPARTSGLRQYVLALLPLENRTGDADLAWVKLGLLSLSIDALELDQRLDIVSIATVLKAIEAFSEEMDFAAKATILRRVAGVTWIAQAAIDSRDGGFVLSYRLFGQGSEHEGQLYAPELTRLAPMYAKAIEAAMFAEGAAAIDLQSHDPFAVQLFCRAQQAWALGLARQTHNLTRVVMDLIPGQKMVRLAHLKALGRLLDPEVLALGDELLLEAYATGDNKLEGQVHIVLATFLSYSKTNKVQQRIHSDAALRCASAHTDKEWARYIYMNAALIAAFDGESERARVLFDSSVDACKRSGTRNLEMLTVLNRGALEATEGNLLTARGLWERVALDANLLLDARGRAALQTNLAEVTAALGFFDDSLRVCYQAAEQVISLDTNGAERSDMLCNLCVRWSEAGHSDAIAGALEQVNEIDMPASDMEQVNLSIMRSLQCVTRGETDAAHLLINTALAQLIASKMWWKLKQYGPLAVYQSMRRSAFEEAENEAQRLLALPTMCGQPDLQGQRLHASALSQHRAGGTYAALALMIKALNHMRPSRWMMLAKLDLAWLYIEAGNIYNAYDVLSHTYAWPSHHPLGLLVSARLHAAKGNHKAASEAQDRALRMLPTLSSEQYYCADVYRRLAQSEFKGEIILPIVKKLPSMA